MTACVLLAGLLAMPAARAADAPAPGSYDFAYAQLDRDQAQIRYGTLALTADGHVKASFWVASGRDPIPARRDINEMAPTIEPQGKQIATDRGARVVSHPGAFRGAPHEAAGQWWTTSAGVCVQFGQRDAILMNRIALGAADGWGAIYRNGRDSRACERADAHGSARAAPSTTVAVLSERVYDRARSDIKVHYQRFSGLITRLNGWDPSCKLSIWEPTSLNFTSGTFGSVGHYLWRAVSTEHPKGGDMQVFSYIALPDRMTSVGRVVLMDVGHDFNRNGRIDDDWGHIYEGFPIISRAGQLGGMLMVDTSPVGLSDVPFRGGCMVAGGKQITHTLGLILYLSDEMKPALH